MELGAWEGGPLLVLGGPGTGKTALAVEEAARRLRAGDAPALVLTHARQAASEIRDRVTMAAGRASVQPPVMTVHALCLSLLQRYGDPEDGPPRLLTAPEQEFRIRELVSGWGPGRWPPGFAEAYRTGSFARQVRAALARARQLGLDPEDVAALGAAAGEPAWEALGAFMADYLDVLDLEGALDYAELVHRARLVLERPDVGDAVRDGFGAVLVDELAELDPAQLGLVRSLVPGSGTVVGLADPDSAIYRFRGAHPRPASAFRALFAPPDGEVPVLVLSDNHRSGQALVRAAHGVRSRLGVPVPENGLARAYREQAGRGTTPARVDVWTFATPADEAARVAAEVRAAHLERGLAWGEMAVLVRSGRSQIPPLARALVDAGVPVEVAGDEIGLASELAVRPLLLALEVAGRGGVPDPDEEHRLLTSGWGGLDAVALRAVRRGTTGGPADVFARRRALLAEAAVLVAGDRRPEDVLWHLWSGTPWPDDLRRAALGGGEDAPRAHRDLDAVAALFALAGASQAPGGERGVRAFLAEVAEQQIPADTQREAAVRGRGVRVMTAHRAKGRSWGFVVVAGVQEGVWPDVRRRGSLLDPERLAPDGLVTGVRTRDLVASERRLFHLACTRARSRLLVTAVAGTEGEADQPSRFLSELGERIRPESAGVPGFHTLRGLVAGLRSVVVDPEAPSGLRDAAATRLARLSTERDDAGRPLVAEADPARWWGMAEPGSPPEAPHRGPLVLSPSQLSSLLACPRRYFLEREARAEPRRSSAAVFGSVIHALAEHAARDGVGREEALAWLDDVWDSLPFAAAWLSESERVEAELAVTRLMNWFDAHATADVVGTEVPFAVAVEVDGVEVTVRGTVDRLERLPSGALRVIDFKSSRFVPTAASVAAHEQLGAYQLAVEAGAFAAVAPGATTSAGGELVFLRAGDDVLPKTLGQEPLRARPHLTDDPDELRHPTWVHHRLGLACATLRSGRWDATPGAHCGTCPFASSCPTSSRQVVA